MTYCCKQSNVSQHMISRKADVNIFTNRHTYHFIYMPIGPLMVCDGILRFIQRFLCFLSQSLGQGIENPQRVR